MSMRKQLELAWLGKEYKLMVTMEVIDRVDDKINIGRLLTRQNSNDIRYSHMAKFVSILLNEAGADTTQEQLFDGMFNGEGSDINEMIRMTNSIFSAFYPEPKKKDLATTKKATAKARKATLGTRSTK